VIYETYGTVLVDNLIILLEEFILKTKCTSRMLSFATAAFITMAASTQIAVDKVHAASSGQEILITEIMPMSQASDDSYEYIELYNNSDKNIDLKDYKLPLQKIDITTSKIIAPKGILVVCTRSSTTLGDFNTFYGTSLTSDKYITLPFVDEILSNSSAVSVLLAKDDSTVVVRANYSSTDFMAKKGVTYKYSQSDFNMIRLGQIQSPTPGSITSDQVPQNGIRVTGITLNKLIVTMDTNKTTELYATVAPATAADKSIVWKSSDSDIVVVSQKGVLTSKEQGVANITATTIDGGFTASCTVYVTRIPVTAITLDKTNVSVDIGKAMILTATVTPENATNISVNWSSSNSNIASVDSNGIVIGKAAGEVTITAATVDGNKTATCKVIVNAINIVVPVTGMSLDNTNVTLKTGNAIILEPKISPSNATNRQVTWTSSNISVATVDNQNGIITAKQSGTALITATSVDRGYKAYCTVTVTNSNDSYIPAVDIQLNTNVIQMIKGQNESLTATISPANAANKSITWSTDDSSVVYVDSYGKVTALKQGIAIVTAKTANGGLKDRCFIIVKDEEITDKTNFKMRLNKTSIRVKEGKFEKLTPIPGYMKNTTLVWTSSNDSIAYITEDGRVFGENEGEAVITVTATTKDGIYSATCKVQVTDDDDNGNGKYKWHWKWDD
jgi:uncharacterized protein YjdB